MEDEGRRYGPLSLLNPSQKARYSSKGSGPVRVRFGRRRMPTRMSARISVCLMRLERLEINGFKSFSDRSELAFDKGVTAIVGPNGCGKSNVADAITWVMGEQSAKSLRGDRMEDVIFSGSDARKPTAAAEVRLRFSGVLKSVTGPAFGDEAGHGERQRAPERQRERPSPRTKTANGNGHHAVPGGDPRRRVLAVSVTRRRQPRADSVRRTRRRGDAASVPLGRERIPDRRRRSAGCATCTTC